MNTIITYSTEMWGERRMKTYIQSLSTALNDLSQFPGMGRTRDDIASGLRGYPVGQHLVLYRVTDSEVFIVRLLHRSRDIEREINE